MATPKETKDVCGDPLVREIKEGLKKLTDHDEIVEYLREHLCENIVELWGHNARCGRENDCPYIPKWELDLCPVEIAITQKVYTTTKKQKDEEFIYNNFKRSD